MDLSRKIPKRRRRGEIRALHCEPVVWPREHEELAAVADSVPVEDKGTRRVSERVVEPH
jgi:hypothetical protein